jgi:hypothetical protein
MKAERTGSNVSWRRSRTILIEVLNPLS